MTNTVSYSEVGTYLRCRRMHYYGYHLGLERNDTSQSLALGKALHSTLESYYGHVLAAGDDLGLQQAAHTRGVQLARQTWENVRPDPDTLKNRADLTHALFGVGMYFDDEPFVMKGFRVLAVEREFMLTWGEDGESYPFVPDLILMDPWGEMAVVDHKTGYDHLSDGLAEHIATQLPLYLGALRAQGYPAIYGIYNQFRTRKIKDPSRDQQLKVTPIHPPDTRIIRTFKEQVALSKEVNARKAMPIEEADDSAYRIANMMICRNCSFSELCIADLQGSNSQLVIETQFHPRTRRSYAVVSEEFA